MENFKNNLFTWLVSLCLLVSTTSAGAAVYFIKQIKETPVQSPTNVYNSYPVEPTSNMGGLTLEDLKNFVFPQQKVVVEQTKFGIAQPFSYYSTNKATSTKDSSGRDLKNSTTTPNYYQPATTTGLVATSTLGSMFVHESRTLNVNVFGKASSSAVSLFAQLQVSENGIDWYDASCTNCKKLISMATGTNAVASNYLSYNYNITPLESSYSRLLFAPNGSTSLQIQSVLVNNSGY